MGKHLDDLRYFLSEDAPKETRSVYRKMVIVWICTAIMIIASIIIAVGKLLPSPACYIPLILAVFFTVMSILFFLAATKE